MKRVIYFFFLSILFFNCDNDLDINAEWEEIPVIYSILNSGADNDCDGDGVLNQYDDGNCKDHFVRVQKSFLGNYPASQMAQISDSIYYSQEEVVVWIEQICGGDTTSFDLEFVDSFEKPDDGYFSTENHHFYKFSEQLDDACDYRINFLNQFTGKTSSATTSIVEPIDVVWWPTIGSFAQSSDGIFDLEIPTTGNSPTIKKIEIRPSKNGKLYNMFLRFNYIEVDQLLETKDTLFIDWNFSPKTATEYQVSGNSSNSNTIIFDFNAIEFFQFIASSIPEKENVYRYTKGVYLETVGGAQDIGVMHPCLEFHFEILDTDLYNYFSSQNSSGLIQNRPIYTNVQNGVGLVSSISTQSFFSVKMNNQTNNDLATSSITSHLNFRCFNTGNIDNFGSSDCQ